VVNRTRLASLWLASLAILLLATGCGPDPIGPMAPGIWNVSPLSGATGGIVTFEAQLTPGSGFPSYSWDFGAGAVPSTSTSSSPTVTLGAPGSYTCHLHTENGQGEDDFTFTVTIN
jgi:hypothetical protein